MKRKFRPPAVPLITNDPYFNVWSGYDRLTDGETRHWTGKTQGMVGMAVIDGKVWRFLGGFDRRSDFPTLEADTMSQTGVEVLPLRSIYTFEAGGVILEVEFMSPLLLDDLDVMGRPASYVTFNAVSNDGHEHSVRIYFDLTAEMCVDVTLQEVVSSRVTLSDNSKVLMLGTKEQPILKRSGDDIRIDWGYVCLGVPGAATAKTAISSIESRSRYASHPELQAEDDVRFPRKADDNMPVAAVELDLGTVNQEARSEFLVLAYDDIFSIEYFGERLPGYWKRDGQTREEMLLAAIRDYSELRSRCSAFDKKLIQEATLTGGQKYADLISIAYRQAVAAHKLAADREGNVLFFSKENFSNGCMGTVDVSYPSIPLFLLYNPELVKGMLGPIFLYASSEEWPYEFAPHDVGRFPLANGQAYGLLIDRQMPIEECGNMLIMTAAVCVTEGRPDFALDNWVLLEKWSRYLLENGMDPGNQLCTDDFAGHLAHNANLSVKAIIGIACYGLLCIMSGKDEEGREYLNSSKKMAVQWETMAREEDHYKLAFDSPGSWSLKYNLVWDRLFELDLFPDEIRKKEIQYYISKRNKYGTPLDNRSTYTKADWLLWVAAMTDTQKQFEQLVDPLWDFLNETFSRVPFTDWYYTIDGRMTGFINRSVVGGIFIRILAARQTLVPPEKIKA